MFSDLDQIARRIERVEKDLKKKKEPHLEQELVLLNRCKAAIESEKPLRELEFNPEERKMINGYKFLSQRPMLYVLNLGDSEVAELDTAVERHKFAKLVGRPNTAVRFHLRAHRSGTGRTRARRSRRKCSRPTGSNLRDWTA